jgi:hypothetical protein
MRRFFQQFKEAHSCHWSNGAKHMVKNSSEPNSIANPWRSLSFPQKKSPDQSVGRVIAAPTFLF